MENLIKRYGVYGLIRLVLDFFVSKLLYPNALLIRRPFYIRIEGKIKFGKGFTSGPGLILDIFGKRSELIIGDNVKVNHNVHIGCARKITIGNNVLMASGVYISDHSHGCYSGINQDSPEVAPNNRPLYTSPVVIGDNCWLGERVTVLPGVTIGNGVIVGAGAVVRSDLPPNCIAVGAPARVIKKYNFIDKQWISI